MKKLALKDALIRTLWKGLDVQQQAYDHGYDDARAGLVALGQDAEMASRAIAPCEWCGRHHDRLALCSPRPLARGISRRSFLQVGAVATIGALLPTPPLGEPIALIERPGPSYVSGVDVGVGVDRTVISYRGIPVVAIEFCPRNVVYIVSTEFRLLIVNPETKAAYVADCRANARFTL